MTEYRSREVVTARRIDKPRKVATTDGVLGARAGDYLVRYENGVTRLHNAVWFEKRYSEIKGDSEFHSAGHTVEQVIEFLKGNPDQVDRVKREEKAGANRKGIAEYEIG